MKPTLAQRFFASNWALRIWFSFTSLATTAYCLQIAKFHFEYLSDWQTGGKYLLIVIPSFLLGFMLGVFPGCTLLGILFNVRSIVNGGPFKPGDTVQIIGGASNGTVTKIYSGWQGTSLRVDLGDEAKKVFKDIFQPTQLLKVNHETVSSNIKTLGRT